MFHSIQSPSKIEALVKTLEKEREYYKDECETLQGMLRKRLMETGSPSSKRKGRSKGKVNIYSSRTHLSISASIFIHCLSPACFAVRHLYATEAFTQFVKCETQTSSTPFPFNRNHEPLSGKQMHAVAAMQGKYVRASDNLSLKASYLQCWI